MNTAAAASRLGVDASTVGKYIRRGLTKTGLGCRLRLRAQRTTRGYQISPSDVKYFRHNRKRLGL